MPGQCSCRIHCTTHGRELSAQEQFSQFPLLHFPTAQVLTTSVLRLIYIITRLYIRITRQEGWRACKPILLKNNSRLPDSRLQDEVGPLWHQLEEQYMFVPKRKSHHRGPVFERSVRYSKSNPKKDIKESSLAAWLVQPSPGPSGSNRASYTAGAEMMDPRYCCLGANNTSVDLKQLAPQASRIRSRRWAYLLQRPTSNSHSNRGSASALMAKSATLDRCFN